MCHLATSPVRAYRVARVPVTKGLGRGNTYIGQGHDAGCGRKIGKRINLFAPANAQYRPANEEKRDIGTDFGGDAELFRSRQRGDSVRPKLAFQSDEGRNCICRARAESALYGQPLVDMDA